MPAPSSVLLIMAAPDDRVSTASLRDVVTALDHRTETKVAVWYLRDGVVHPWPGAKVVDSLRTWGPAAFFEGVGLGAVASKLRGLRLRQWLRSVAPDVVILDDGLGRRVLEPLSTAPFVVARLNAVPSPQQRLEPEPSIVADLYLTGPGTDDVVPPGAPAFAMPDVRDYASVARLADATHRRTTRSLLELPVDEPLVVGWGSHGWLDGPDLFVRGLWALADRHRIDAHGLWLSPGLERDDIERLTAEAERCGLGDRLHIRRLDTLEARQCADVTFLPSRAPGMPYDLLAAVAGGQVVVTFPVHDVDDPAVVAVPHLDLDAAAAALARGLDGDRDARRREAATRLPDVRPWLQSLLDEISGRVRS